jgi:hypothetical protein
MQELLAVTDADAPLLVNCPRPAAGGDLVIAELEAIVNGGVVSFY